MPFKGVGIGRAGTGLIRLDCRLPSPRPAPLSLQISFHWQYISFMQRESRIHSSLTVVYRLRQRLLWYFFHISPLFDCEYISALSHFLQQTCDYWPPPRCYPQEVVRVGPCHRGVSPSYLPQRGISSTLQIEIINLVRKLFKYRAVFHLPALLMWSQTETGHGKLVLLR